MKKLFAFSINTVWELIKYIKPLYELIAAIVKIIKNDNGNDNGNGNGNDNGNEKNENEDENEKR